MHRLPRLVRSSGVAKPRVLLVDDHRGVLEWVSALLADDCDVAGVATDGRQALDSVGRIAPDLVVLDINREGLDRRLRDAGWDIGPSGERHYL